MPRVISFIARTLPRGETQRKTRPKRPSPTHSRMRPRPAGGALMRVGGGEGSVNPRPCLVGAEILEVGKPI